MHRPPNPHRTRRARQGYVMVVALMLLATLAILGTSTLRVSAVDHRLAIQNARHMVMMNTADAGIGHARNDLALRDPYGGWNHDNRYQNRDLEGDTGNLFVTQVSGEELFGGLSYAYNLGVYEVSASYERCGQPPSGYSTEIGAQEFRSDYWRVESVSTTTDASLDPLNESTATVVSIIRKASEGGCRMN